MIPYGVGTSLEGHILAVKGGVCVDLSQMNQVLTVHEADLDAVVQAGVTRKQLNEHIRHTGLFFPIDPGADATIGGMAATRASGTNAVRYGTMRENVISLTVVLADGRIIKTARRAKKSAAGYDLTRLFVGSEGTLGIITEITVRLYAVQEAMSAAVCAFDSVEGCTRTVIQTIQAGVPVARCEIVDATAIGCINRYNKTDYRVAPTLFFEFHGTRGKRSRAGRSGAGHRQGQRRPGFPVGDQGRGPHQTVGGAPRFLLCRPAASAWLPGDFNRCVRADFAPGRVRVRNHEGRGRLYLPGAAGRARGRRQLSPDVPGGSGQTGGAGIAAKSFNKRLVERALAMEGTCTGEHGVGYGKMKYLEAEHGLALEVMRTLKRALDPDNRMNPGKMVKV